MCGGRGSSLPSLDATTDFGNDQLHALPNCVLVVKVDFGYRPYEGCGRSSVHAWSAREIGGSGVLAHGNARNGAGFARTYAGGGKGPRFESSA